MCAIETYDETLSNALQNLEQKKRGHVERNIVRAISNCCKYLPIIAANIYNLLHKPQSEILQNSVETSYIVNFL